VGRGRCARAGDGTHEAKGGRGQPPAGRSPPPGSAGGGGGVGSAPQSATGSPSDAGPTAIVEHVRENALWTRVPSPNVTPTITAAIAATIRPYSVALAPRSCSLRRMHRMLGTGTPPLVWRGYERSSPLYRLLLRQRGGMRELSLGFTPLPSPAASGRCRPGGTPARTHGASRCSSACRTRVPASRRAARTHGRPSGRAGPPPG
jgi:hypothetical protein